MNKQHNLHFERFFVFGLGSVSGLDMCNVACLGQTLKPMKYKSVAYPTGLHIDM